MRISLFRFIFLLNGLFMLIGPAFGQDSPLILEGRVFNQLSEPLAGVSVSVEGALKIPSVSDQSGNFTIEMPSRAEWILFSPSEGYKKRRMYVENRKVLHVFLSEVEDISGDDLIQHPGGIRPLKHSTASVQIPDIRSISYSPVQSVDQFLNGLVPGMQATGSSGMPGSGSFAAIRGIRSMRASSQPLYIIDGIPIENNGVFSSGIAGYSYNALASIDPNDITSIQVHKGNSAGMFYGMRGSNGVVMIETLKPSEVRTIIDFGYRTGIRTMPREIPQLNSAQHRSLANEVLYSSGAHEEQFMNDYPGLFLAEGEDDYFRYNHQTNWQEKVIRNAVFNDTYFRVRGGDQIARYGLSVGYLKHNGVIDNTNMDRLNIRFIGTFSIFSWLRMYVTSNLSNSKYDLKDGATFPQGSPLLTALLKSPLLSPYAYDQDGRQTIEYQDANPFGVSNPSVIIDNGINNIKTNRFRTSFRLEGDLTPRLKLNSILGYNYVNSGESTFMPDHGMQLYYENRVDEIYNYAWSMKNLLSTIYNNTYLSYGIRTGKAGELSFSAGAITDMNKWEEDFGLAMNSNRNDEYRSLQSGTSTLREKGGLNEKWNRLSLYGTAMYNYKDKYILNAGLNSQFSSRLGKSVPQEDGIVFIGNEPFGVFYSTGVAWRLSEEVFMQEMYWLEDLKLRFNWGTSGNDDVGNVSGMQYYSPVLYQRSSGFIPGNMSDNSLRFEKNEQMNAGVDLSLIRNRIGLSLDLYRIKTTDMLLHDPVSSFTGFHFVPENGCDMLTNGWEIQANLRLIKGPNMTWDIMLNLAGSENIITEIKDDEILSSFEGGQFISRKGESLLNYYGYIFDGVYSTSDQAGNAGLVSETGIPYRAGDAIFRDMGEGDGRIDASDRTLIGSPFPELFGGLFSQFSWKRWSLLTHVSFVYGNEVFNYMRYQNESMSSLANQSTYTLNRWQYDGQQTNVPRALWDDPVGNSAFSSRWIEDGSYLKLSNLALSYRLPDDLGFLKNAEVFVSAQNLFTVSGYLGYDPEFSYSFRNLEQGIDYGLTPHTRSYMLGIKLGF